MASTTKVGTDQAFTAGLASLVVNVGLRHDDKVQD